MLNVALIFFIEFGTNFVLTSTIATRSETIISKHWSKDWSAPELIRLYFDQNVNKHKIRNVFDYV